MALTGAARTGDRTTLRADALRCGIRALHRGFRMRGRTKSSTSLLTIPMPDRRVSLTNDDARLCASHGAISC
jgi:hypothetical protein